ncbi:polyketide synthase dehydratase domain-containing protein, partial [Bacillus atrophaeus]|uniref:phosphopantetheine-binding protein n=1 Tax=Bacillus atrophaeus TaxID=1452 RepID=UPI00227E04AE
MITEQLSLSLQHPIMQNHKVYGQALLPGLAYIDLIYQVFQEHGYAYQELELKHVTIFHPLIAEETYDIILSIHVSESNEGKWVIQIDGQKQQGDLLTDKKQYVTAEMHQRESVAFSETIDMTHWEKTADKVVDLHDIYDQCRRHELVHTGMMKAKGQIYETGEGALIDISVGQEALVHSESFMFHPTLIDSSGLGSSVLLSNTNQDRQTLYLPLFYESFSASELLQKECAARIQSSSVRQEKELTYMTIEYFNQQGKKVAELKNFASKSVREAEAIHPERKETNRSQAMMQRNESVQTASADNSREYAAIEEFLRQLLAEQLGKPAEQIETHAGYYELGLDSPSLLETVQAIGSKIGADLSPTLLFEYTTIAELSAYAA